MAIPNSLHLRVPFIQRPPPRLVDSRKIPPDSFLPSTMMEGKLVSLFKSKVDQIHLQWRREMLMPAIKWNLDAGNLIHGGAGGKDRFFGSIRRSIRFRCGDGRKCWCRQSPDTPAIHSTMLPFLGSQHFMVGMLFYGRVSRVLQFFWMLIFQFYVFAEIRM